MNKYQLLRCNEVLQQYISQNSSADNLLRFYFKNNKNLGSQDRREIAEVYYEVIRNKLMLEKVTESKDSLSLIIYQLIKEEKLAEKILEELNYKSSYFDIKNKLEKSELKKWEVLSMPEWIYNLLVEEYGSQEAIEILTAMLEKPYLDARINLLKTDDREKIISQIEKNNPGLKNKLKIMKYSPLGIRFPRGYPLQNQDEFKQGLLEVQDEGSQLLCYLLDVKPKQMVADFCAGAGGKTLLLASLMKNSGRLYAFDINQKRLLNMKKRLARANVSNVMTHLIDNENDIKVKRLHKKFDRVFVDAPCSGLGTLRRNPDLKWKYRKEDIEEMHQKQIKILTAASKLLKEDGLLLYATCSLIQRENEAVVEKFLEENKDFQIADMNEVLLKLDLDSDGGKYFKLLSHKKNSDSFFGALLKRVGK